jgi:hypothetical protein
MLSIISNVITSVTIEGEMMKKIWTESYQDWAGNFDQLVATACEVLADLGDGSESLSAHLVRHYQNQKAVGRGERVGKSAVFKFRQLAEVVATKRLIADGWTVAKIAEVLPNLPTHELEAITSPSSGESLTQETSEQALERESGASADTKSSKAVDVVARLKRRAGGQSAAKPALPSQVSFASSPPANPSLIGSPFGYADPGKGGHAWSSSPTRAVPDKTGPDLTSIAYQNTRSRIVPEGVASYAASAGLTSTVRETLTTTPAPWLTAHIDASSVAGVDDTEIDRAVEALRRAITIERDRRR